MIAIKGQKNRLQSIWRGDLTPYAAVYVGDVRVWPDVTGDAGFIVGPPDAGTVDFLYWLHALDATADKAARGAYMYFEVNGRKFYFNRAPNGMEKVTAEGDVVNLTRAQMEWMQPYLGDELVVHAEIPERYGDVFSVGEVNGSVAGMEMLPWLPGSGLHVEVDKGQKRVSAGCRFSVTGSPSGMVHIQGKAQKNGHRRGTYSDVAYARAMNVINGSVEQFSDAWVQGDYVTSLSFETYNNCTGRAHMVWPAFKRDFRLSIISVS